MKILKAFFRCCIYKANGCMRWHSWLRHCATILKAAIPLRMVNYLLY